MGAIGQGRDDAFCIELIGLFIAWGDFGLGGFWLGGILAWGDFGLGDIDRGDFVWGILARGDFVWGDFVQGGFGPGGFCPGGFCPVTVIIPEKREAYFRERNLWLPSESCDNPHHREQYVKAKTYCGFHNRVVKKEGS